MDPKGHAALVTGAGSGLGAATATALAQAGAKVSLLDIDFRAAQGIAARIDGFALPCDVADADSGAAAVTAAREATPLGRAVFKYMGSRPSAQAVRYRRRLLADLIDRTAKRGDATVLAIAAGHLREAELSAAVQSGAVHEFVALDQDENSLGVVDRDYSRVGIRTLPGSVRQILAGKIDPGRYDLVYAAGLFDYLSAPVAAAFARRMFDMVRPGGLMLIPNFFTGARDTGYMESFMDWHLIYRDDADMRSIASALPKDAVARAHVFADDVNTITYLLVSKA